MLKKIVLMGLLAMLAGCLSPQDTHVFTQAKGEVALKADQYSIQVNFTAQGKTSDGVLAQLNANLTDFLKWKLGSGFKVVTQNQSIQPMYHFPKNGLRQLTGYQARHSFQVKGLNLTQYDDAMKTLAGFNPESLHQGEVGVSDVVRKKALQQAYELAFVANREKLTTLTNLAKLCWPKAIEIKEHTQSQGGPRSMVMSAKAAPIANEHTISVRLEITWQASHC